MATVMTTMSRQRIPWLIGACAACLWGHAVAGDFKVQSITVPDTIVIVDQSRSMAPSLDWLADLLTATDTSLGQRIGPSAPARRYGLVALDYRAYQVSLGRRDWRGAVESLAGNLRRLSTDGSGREDGYGAIGFALERYGAAADDRVTVLLVTDEDRDVVWHELDFEAVADDLAATQTVLDVVVNVRLRCEDGSRAFGMNAAGDGFVVRDGAVAVCANVDVQLGPRISNTDDRDGTLEDYVDLALGTGGTVWAIGEARGDEHSRAKFAKAFAAHRMEMLAAAMDALPLHAVASVQPARVGVAEVVTLDGSGSRARLPTLDVDTWEWDFDGDGRFDASGPVVATIFTKPGERVVTLRVGDSGARIAVESAVIVPVAGN